MGIYSFTECMDRKQMKLKKFENNGITICGTSLDNLLVEVIEISSEPFFLGVQYHPEFKSRPNKAHPLFKKFVYESLRKKGL